MDGKLFYSCGSSRSGKTAWVRQQIESENRVCVWDPESQYAYAHNDKLRQHPLPGWVVVTSRRDLLKALEYAKRKPLKISYVVSSNLKEEFDFWGRACFAWAKALPSLKTVTVAEELSDVTSPAKAPDGWGLVVRRSLKYWNDIYAVTQRPAESDKSALGNATIIHCGRLNRDKDRKYMADEMALSPDEVPTAPLDWVEVDELRHKTSGTLKFSDSNYKEPPKKPARKAAAKR